MTDEVAVEKATVGLPIHRNGVHTPTAISGQTTAHTAASTASGAGDMELSENFYINSRRKSNVKIQVKLNGEGIFLRRETEQANHVNEQLIRIADIIGSRCGPRLRKRARGGLSSCKRDPEHDQAPAPDESAPSSGQPKDTSAYLYIYAYIKQEKPLRRNRTVRILRFRSNEHYEQNLTAAERWHRAIAAYKNHQSSMVAALTADSMAQRKQLLILLNPKSGSGKGREMFHKQVAPILKEAEIQYELLVTSHPNFARDLVRTRRDLHRSYSGIVVASGDGLFHEVLNGLMERSDWRLIARHLPFGIIPCGSGNGLAKSIAHLYNEPYEPKPILNATLNCISGRSTLMDIVRVELANRKTGERRQIYSFLSVGWGLIADVDIESERLRSFGAQRFTLWTIHRLINLRTYKGKLSYLPWQGAHGVQASELVPAAVSEHQAVLRTHSTQRTHHREDPAADNTSQEFYDLPEIASDDDDDEEEFADVISLDRSSIRPNTDSWHSAVSRRTAYYSIGGHSVRSQRSIAAASIQSKIEAANAAWASEAPASKIPAIDMPIPAEGWRTEEGDYIMVHAAYASHLSSDCHFAPQSRLNDGIIYLVIIRAGVSRAQLVQFLLGLSTGSHLPDEPNEFIEILPVTAFRIEPVGDAEGILNVDGERVDYGIIQCEIFSGMINVMVPH